MSKISARLKAMQEQFANEGTRSEGSGGKRFYNFSKMDFDQSVTLRFLPDKNPDNPWGFLHEVWNHNLVVNGRREQIACVAQHGKSCAICKQAGAFYDAEDKAAGGKFYRKKSFLAQVLILDDPQNQEVDPENPIRLVNINPQIFGIIKEAFTSGELDNAEPDAMKGGYNFIIKKTKGGMRPDGKGHFPTYVLGTKFQNKPTDLPDELIEIVEKNLVDLSTIAPKEPEQHVIESTLEAALADHYGNSNKPAAGARPAFRPRPQEEDDIPFEDSVPSRSPAAAAPSVGSATQDLLARLRRTTSSD